MRGSTVEPLTIITPDAVIERFLHTPGGRIYALDDEAHQAWGAREQWFQYVLRLWQELRPKEPPPPPRTVKSGDPIAIIGNRGFF